MHDEFSVISNKHYAISGNSSSGFLKQILNELFELFESELNSDFV